MGVYSPSPAYFAAEGRRVRSASDPGIVEGEVVRWISPSEFIVRWEKGPETVCTTADVEPTGVDPD